MNIGSPPPIINYNSIVPCANFSDKRRSKDVREWHGKQTEVMSHLEPAAFIPAMQRGEPQAASKGAPIAPGSPKVAPRAGLPLSARIPNPVLPAGLEHRRSLFRHKTSRALFARAGAAIF